jgi:hypothetical protein
VVQQTHSHLVIADCPLSQQEITGAAWLLVESAGMEEL